MEAATYADGGVPLSSPKYREAVTRGGFTPPSMKLGGVQGWPNETAVLRVSTCTHVNRLLGT